MRSPGFLPARDGLADRMAGFVAHLRMNGLKLGPGETGDALAVLSLVDATDPTQARAGAARAAGAGRRWLAHVRRSVRRLLVQCRQTARGTRHRHMCGSNRRVRHCGSRISTTDRKGPTTKRRPTTPDDDGDRATAEGTDGRLIATRTDESARRDLRELMDEDSLRDAEAARAADGPRDPRPPVATAQAGAARRGNWTCGAFSAPAWRAAASRWTCTARRGPTGRCGSWRFATSAAR